MAENSSIAVIGGGPCGMTAARVLAEAGLPVTMLDGGQSLPPGLDVPSFDELRRRDVRQWNHVLGSQFQALGAPKGTTPKARVPHFVDMFSRYEAEVSPRTKDFVLRGSLAIGGLTNAWGAGVACFNDADLAAFPVRYSMLAESYLRVASHIGVCGVSDDALGDFFGKDIPLHAPPELDPGAKTLLTRYRNRPLSAHARGIRIGIARSAVVTRPHRGRDGCVLCNLCLFGCAKRSIYNASFDLDEIQAYPNFTFIPGVHILKLERNNQQWQIHARKVGSGQRFQLTARHVFLACGTIGTGRIILHSLGLANRPVPFMSTPIVSFALWQPERLGSPMRAQGFGLSQLSFVVDGLRGTNEYAFGNIFSTSGLLTSDIIEEMPLSRGAGRRLAKLLLPSMLVGNCFFPGQFSDHRLLVDEDGGVEVRGGVHSDLKHCTVQVRRRLSGVFARYGTLMLPRSFRLWDSGSDLHYVGTARHSREPASHETFPDGSVAGLRDVFVVDGAALGILPSKAHTLTLMANADRIARAFVDRMRRGTSV